MGGGASKVDPIEAQEEMMRRISRASNDRNRLVLMSLNTSENPRFFVVFAFGRMQSFQ